MSDLESVLADVSYLMTIEKSRTPGAKTMKKVVLPDCSVHDVVHKWLTYKSELTFKKIYKQRIGAYFLEKFIPESCLLLNFLKGILDYEKTATLPARKQKGKLIYDKFIYADLLAMDLKYPKEITDEITSKLKQPETPSNLFKSIKEIVYSRLTLQYMPDFIQSPQYIRFCQWKYMEYNIPHSISLSDFSIHRIIGRGGFGEVFGCRKDDSGRMFAMKLLDKKRIKVKKGELLSLNERNMLAKVNSPFVVNLYYAFQTPEKLCFILDLMNGGDLHYHLTQHGVFNEEEVKFYAAELVLALEHIHGQKMVYRDLKPSNILLDEIGHVRISDLGLACEFQDRKPSSCVGTHGYMAPEVIKKGVHYDSSADWFSLGCVLYKLLRGHTPFRSSNKEDIDQITLTKEVHIPSSVSPEMGALLTGLLEKDVGKRLGCRGRGADELKEMPFFANINWDDTMEKKLVPPLVPPRGEVNAADAFDIGSFDSDETRGIKMTEDDQKIYTKFSVVVSDRWQMEMMESIFQSVNAEKDKQEAKDKAYYAKKGAVYYSPEHSRLSGCLLQGFGHKQSTSMLNFVRWQQCYLILYPNRVAIGDNLLTMSKGTEMSFEDASMLVESKNIKGADVIRIQPIGGKKEFFFKFDSQLEHQMWFRYLRSTIHQFANTQGSTSPLALEDGGIIIQRRDSPQSPARQARKLGLTKSVPIL